MEKVTGSSPVGSTRFVKLVFCNGLTPSHTLRRGHRSGNRFEDVLLWTLTTDSGVTFSLHTISVTANSSSAFSRSVGGKGILYINGVPDLDGAHWQVAFLGATPVISTIFGVTYVPEGGVTLALLIGVLAGLEGLRRLRTSES
jgi:hypothetical protein